MRGGTFFRLAICLAVLVFNTDAAKLRDKRQARGNLQVRNKSFVFSNANPLKS
jgi:hypothetical protein